MNAESFCREVRRGRIPGIELVRFDYMETVVAVFACPLCRRQHSIEVHDLDSLAPSEERVHA
jgi:hypothetical protein